MIKTLNHFFLIKTKEIKVIKMGKTITDGITADNLNIPD
jgi:hypothetical protein